jgi:hypothetical protein
MIVLLTGLRPNNPLAAMAAYGVLRLLRGSKLRWTATHPEIQIDDDPIDALAATLQARRSSLEVNLFDDPRDLKTRECYLDVASRLPPEWQVVTASEASDQNVKTDLLLMGGKHKFVANARSIMDTLLRQDVPSKLREALYGPWKYEEKGLQAWGWDPGATIDTAASSRAGTSTPKYGVSAASWLAWESLPLWPLVNGRTIGWVARRGFCYPTFKEWLDWQGLRAITLGLECMNEREAGAVGITTWLAPEISTSQYGSVLGWGRPVARTISVQGNKGGSRSV